MNKGQGATLWRNDFSEHSLELFFKKIESSIDDQTFVFFSLDADALIGSEMPGVSAVNPGGLTRKELLHVWKCYKKLSMSHLPAIGIYELNPLYDTLSSFSMRTVASFVFESFE